MKKMRQILALVLALVMVLSCFAGCSQNQEEKPEETKSQQQGGSKETTPVETEKTFSHPVTTEPITISILTTRHSSATNNAEDIWFFKYLEYWLHEEYGYNVTLDVQQTMEPDQQISLLLGTDSLPDIVWGIPLTTTQAVVYGEGEGMIMDMTQWLNETYMPNAYASIYNPDNSSYLVASTTPNGGIYGMPQINGRGYLSAESTIGYSQDRMFFYMPWLEEIDKEMPTNLEEFYAILEAYKGKKTEDGADVIPLLSNSDFNAYLERAFWTMLGYYGNELTKYGSGFAIKNAEVVLPVYTDDYVTFIEIMNHLYTNGYLSPDYLTLDKSTVRGLTKQGVAGVVSDATMGSLMNWENWKSMPWFPINEGDEVHISTGTAPRIMQTWVSASTEYPEIVALILDYMYTVEGAALYNYGPKQGEDPLGMVDGWYWNENGVRTTKLVDDGTYGGFTGYSYQYIFSYTYVGMDNSLLFTPEALEYLGMSTPYTEHELLDTVTGDTYIAYEDLVRDPTTAQGYWFRSNSEASLPYITTVNLPDVYLSEDDTLYANELFSVLENHIISESAKFITGVRPLSEIPDFQAELKVMGIEDYIALYQDAYAAFMESIFG